MESEAPFTVEELLEQIRREAREEHEGLTSREIAERLGLSQQAVTDRLRELQASGRLGVSWRRARRIDGRTYFAPVYYIEEGQNA